MNSFSWIEKKIASDKTEVVYNGVNISKLKKIVNFNGNDNLFKPQSAFVIGSVGRLVEIKDSKTLIKAFDNLYQNVDVEMNLLIVGNGKEKNTLEKIVTSRGLEDKVIFTGAVERKTVYKLLRQIDIFVITSLAEGFCNTLVEAMAAEKAIVCSDIPTLREVGGDAALFAEPGNPESFSRQINKLLIDKELKNKMKRKATKRAEKFTLEACAKRYMSYYEIN